MRRPRSGGGGRPCACRAGAAVPSGPRCGAGWSGPEGSRCRSAYGVTRARAGGKAGGRAGAGLGTTVDGSV
ncbi:hypothetical protein SHJG_1077 [Streptomyces hygroscopicus subsp. jinggangensis 5008]|nr:hypothetical protein SHJG_1077 [Streptomyces hygroscopicus subsp. jinggangensis 5008]AGF60577.1 hypothetical protein SHJGH_0911 [Streptomyces hygroscopicus subsp. jinggangensis TL01]